MNLINNVVKILWSVSNCIQVKNKTKRGNVLMALCTVFLFDSFLVQTKHNKKLANPIGNIRSKNSINNAFLKCHLHTN